MPESFDPDDLAIVVLAAGGSSRMGTPKQLLPWKGKTLLEHAIEQARNVTENVTVVLGAHASIIRATIAFQGVATIENTEWYKGMGVSLALGVKDICKRTDTKSILVVLADQPLLGQEHLRKLAMTYFKNPHTLVATQYEKRSGVPAVFDATLFEELSQLNADFGARHLIQKHAYTSKAIAPIGQTVDIDTMEIYRTLFEQHGEE